MKISLPNRFNTCIVIVTYNPDLREQLLFDNVDGLINSSKIIWEKVWLSMEKLFNDILLTREDKIQIILDRFNYKSLSYWERIELIKELKEQSRKKEEKEKRKLYDLIKSLKDTSNTQYTKQIKITKELKTFTFLKNIFGNNSAEKPNN